MKSPALSKTNIMNTSELFTLFGKHARYILVGNFYVIRFNGKDLSADNPSDLFIKVKEEYKKHVHTNS